MYWALLKSISLHRENFPKSSEGSKVCWMLLCRQLLNTNWAKIAVERSLFYSFFCTSKFYLQQWRRIIQSLISRLSLTLLHHLRSVCAEKKRIKQMTRSRMINRPTHAFNGRELEILRKLQIKFILNCGKFLNFYLVLSFK